MSMEGGWDLDLDIEPDWASLDWFGDPKVEGCPDGIEDCPIKHALEDRESDESGTHDND